METWLPVTSGSTIIVIVGGGGASNISAPGNSGNPSEILDPVGLPMATSPGGGGGQLPGPPSPAGQPGQPGARGEPTSNGPFVKINADSLRVGLGGTGTEGYGAGGTPGGVIIEWIANQP
jgi:hypothetical protein